MAKLPEITKFDPELTEKVMGILRPLLKVYHRSEVRGLENIPLGGALVVSNHSGGMLPMDVPIFSSHFYDKYGYDRPVYTLSHAMLMVGPTADFFKKTGYILASHENADEALRSGGLVVVFPGGDYDVYRPSTDANKIDFDGRKGYVKAAINAGVPIVPMVGIGGQETQIFLTRGEKIAKAEDALRRGGVLQPFPGNVATVERADLDRHFSGWMAEAEGKIRKMPVAERKEMRDELYGYAVEIAKGLGDARGAQLAPRRGRPRRARWPRRRRRRGR